MNLVLREQVQFQSLRERLSGELFLPTAGSSCPAVVVCHGAGEFKENYIEMCEHLAQRGIGCLAIDMHGHGASGGARFNVRMKEWVADVRAALDFLARHSRVDASRLGGFGLSSGGTAILEASLEDQRLRALVALDATVRNSLPVALSAFLKTLIWIGKAKRRCVGDDLRINLIKLGGGMALVADKQLNDRIMANTAATAALRAFPFPGGAEAFFVDTIERAGRVSAATLVIWGGEDQVDPPATGQILFDALRCRKSLQIIEGNGHLGHLDLHRQRVFELTAHWFSENLAVSTAHLSHLETPAACRAG
jgi:alpha-beta hydrolase superfamily lysophospholipase